MILTLCVSVHNHFNIDFLSFFNLFYQIYFNWFIFKKFFSVFILFYNTYAVSRGGIKTENFSFFSFSSFFFLNAFSHELITFDKLDPTPWMARTMNRP